MLYIVPNLLGQDGNVCEGDQAVQENEGVDEGTAAPGEVPEVDDDDDDDDSGDASNWPDDVTDDDGDEECRKGCWDQHTWIRINLIHDLWLNVQCGESQKTP